MSVAAGVALAKFVLQLSPFDVITYAAVAGAFLITAMLAVPAPAYQAATIDPVVALRRRTPP
jgi:ABC-type lipoprotein release transport system permease subunit